MDTLVQPTGSVKPSIGVASPEQFTDIRHGLTFAVRRDGAKIFASTHIHADYFFFKGHFDRLPLVPGVCQIDMSRLVVCQLAGRTVQFIKMRSVKFKRPIRPETSIEIEVELVEGNEAEFVMRHVPSNAVIAIGTAEYV
jgi:3-hydroxymyristoyl/3-hydroxydecanoyl-(acyl carrier protein) dehydratase